MAKSNLNVKSVSDGDCLCDFEQGLKLQTVARGQLSEHVLPVVELAHPEADESRLCYLKLRVDGVLIIADALPPIVVLMGPDVLAKAHRRVNRRIEAAPDIVARLYLLLILLQNVTHLVHGLIQDLLEVGREAELFHLP